MNNLKIVNDRYGHDEGDFSIKVISEQLIQATKGGIAGRVGGDEFAIIMEYPIERGERVFIEEIYKGFQQYNQTSTKPYNITVSAGTCLISAKAEIGLKEALNLADGKLYEEKQHKEKTVAKG
jgi:diguanylate cyclase (GGDEF)-like protein